MITNNRTNIFKIIINIRYINMKENSYDFLVKLLIIGDSGVGKTNILLRGCDNKFIPSHLMTIGTYLD